MARKLGIAAVLTGLVAILPFINPLVARADTIQYTVYGYEPPVYGPLPFEFTFTEPTLASSGEITSGISTITISPGYSIETFSWNSAAGGSCPPSSFFNPFTGCAGFTIEYPVLGAVFGVTFPAGSFLAPGTYVSGDPDKSLTVTISPEPSTIMLLGTGVLSLFGITRKTRLSLRFKQRA